MEKFKIKMLLDVKNHEDYQRKGIKFAYMTENEIYVREIMKETSGGFKKTETLVVNFKLEGISDVRDFTFSKTLKDKKNPNSYTEMIEVIMKSKVIVYEKNEKLNRYLKNESEEKERGDIDMKHVWKVGADSKGRIILNGINKLTYLESWADNSPDEFLENLYKPVPLKTQSDKIVFKTPTDNSDLMTYWVLTDPKKLELEPSQRKTAFEKVYAFGDYNSAFVTKNYIVFFSKGKNKRIAFFGVDGTLQYDLDSMPSELSGRKGADSVWGNENSLKILYRDRRFSMITKHLKVNDVEIMCTAETPILRIFPLNKMFELMVDTVGVKSGLNLDWVIGITLIGYVLWGVTVIAVLGTLGMICLLLMRKRTQKRNVNIFLKFFEKFSYFFTFLKIILGPSKSCSPFYYDD